MKTKRFVFIVLFFAAFCITGCASLFIKTVTYSFAENESQTAKITFIRGDKVGVRLVDCEDIKIPAPEKGTRWEESSFIFPVGRPLDLRVYVYWSEDRYGERRRGIFKCPPLEAGKKYNLRFKGNYKNGGSLLLYDENTSRFPVYEQTIPPPK